MTQDRPLLGIALMLGFCVTAPFADALAKLLGPLVALGQLVFLRFAFQAAILLPISLGNRGSLRMSRRVLGIVFLRTLLHIAGIACMVSALWYLPLADAVAIAFVMPFVALLLGHYLLGEEVGWRRLAACAVGFLGTLMVVQPAFDDVGWPALLPIAVAVIFALFMLVTRLIAAQSDPVAIQSVSALMALALMLPVLFFWGDVALLAWHPLDGQAWILVALMGGAGTLAHLLMTWSLRFAPASTLVPMQYLEIPVATFMGWLFFDDLPGGLAGLGIAVTVAAGLYVVMRERAMQKAPAPGPASGPRDRSAAG